MDQITFIDEGLDRPRVLTPEEIQTLAPLFAERGMPMPNPASSMFVGTVIDGEVVGFVAVQLRVHADPFWLKPGHEHRLRGLVRHTERVITERVGEADVYLFVPTEGNTAPLAIHMGFDKEPWYVMSKHVGGEIDLVPLPTIPVVDESSKLEQDEREAIQTESSNSEQPFFDFETEVA